MTDMIEESYMEYLTEEKKMSDNTKQAYLRDLKNFQTFILKRGLSGYEEASNAEIVAWLVELKASGRSKATVNRKLASLRSFYHYLEKEKRIQENPAENIKPPKVSKKEIEYLSIEEMERLLAVPDDSTMKGKRDRAILELLYATGIRASELIEMKLEDMNLRMGFVKCSGEHGKARIIPVGRLARKVMEDYVLDVRPVFLKENQTDALFVNYAGRAFTRQGLWKVLKQYGEEAGLELPLTPQIIRNSFAVHMLQNGADIRSLQELMGHEEISATQAYLAVIKNRIKDVYDKTHPRA